MTSIGGGLKSFGKSIKMASLGLLKFVKRIFLAGMALLLGIITPLLPIIIPMLAFAGIVTTVVAGLYLLKKGLNALVDWFKNSTIGKLLGLDDKSQEKKKRKIKKMVQANIKAWRVKWIMEIMEIQVHLKLKL